MTKNGNTKSPKEDRKARLKEALRRNLARRKEATRASDKPQKPSPKESA